MARRDVTQEQRRPGWLRIWLPVERAVALASASLVVWQCRVLTRRARSGEERERRRSWLRTLELRRERLRLSFCGHLTPETLARRAEINRELAELAIARLEAEPPGPLRDYRITAARLEAVAHDRLDGLRADIGEFVRDPALIREHGREVEALLRERGLLPDAEELAELERRGCGPDS